MNSGSAIAVLRSRRVLNSTGRFTIEVDIRLKSGAVGRGSAPAGTTVGSYEAPGISIDKANSESLALSRALLGVDCLQQDAVDGAIETMLGTTSSHRPKAANLACAVSMAACEAAAQFRSVPLYRHVADLAGSAPAIPSLAVNVINGGAHNTTGLSLTECMLIIEDGDPYEMLAAASRVLMKLSNLVVNRFGPAALGSGLEGGLTPRLASIEDTCEILLTAIADEGVSVGFDVAANTLAVHAENEPVKYNVDGSVLSGEELRSRYLGLNSQYPLSYLEDPFTDHDVSTWQSLAASYPVLAGQMGIVSDDLTASDARRLTALEGEDGSFPAHSVIAKVNQCGTISRLLDFVMLSRKRGLNIVVSQRSQETDQSFLADLSVGLGAQMMKAGCITRERIVKYNRLLRIGEELSAGA